MKLKISFYQDFIDTSVEKLENNLKRGKLYVMSTRFVENM